MFSRVARQVACGMIQNILLESTSEYLLGDTNILTTVQWEIETRLRVSRINCRR